MKIGDITRRGALAGAGGLTLAACSNKRPQAEPLPVAEGAFKHGVASGDPDQTSLVVWTALTGGQAGAPVRIEVSADERFSDLVFEGEATQAGPAVTSPDLPPAVPYKALVEGLEPGQSYVFRFVRGGESSPRCASPTGSRRSTVHERRARCCRSCTGSSLVMCSLWLAAGSVYVCSL